MGRISCVDSYIKPYNDVKLVGTAFYRKGSDWRQPSSFIKHSTWLSPGDVIVVDGEANMNHSLCGEIMMHYAIKKGIVGFVIDGCIRDVAAIKDMNFLRLCERGETRTGPYKKRTRRKSTSRWRAGAGLFSRAT